MQLSNEYLVLARGVTTDSEEQSPTLFKIITEAKYEIPAAKFREAFGVEPGAKVVLPASITIASSWRSAQPTREDRNMQATVKILSDTGETQAEVTNSITLPKNKKRIRYNVALEGLPVQRTGTYKVSVTIIEAGKELCSSFCYLDVMINLTEK